VAQSSQFNQREYIYPVLHCRDDEHLFLPIFQQLFVVSAIRRWKALGHLFVTRSMLVPRLSSKLNFELDSRYNVSQPSQGSAAGSLQPDLAAGIADGQRHST